MKRDNRLSIKAGVFAIMAFRLVVRDRQAPDALKREMLVSLKRDRASHLNLSYRLRYFYSQEAALFLPRHQDLVALKHASRAATYLLQMGRCESIGRAARMGGLAERPTDDEILDFADAIQRFFPPDVGADAMRYFAGSNEKQRGALH